VPRRHRTKAVPASIPTTDTMGNWRTMFFPRGPAFVRFVPYGPLVEATSAQTLDDAVADALGKMFQGDKPN